jgi:hypothetical protein
MFARTFLLGVVLAATTATAQQVLQQARRLEAQGEFAKAEALLREAASSPEASASSRLAYAEFLDAHGRASARAAYEDALAFLPSDGEPAARVSITRRLVILSLSAGDSAAAAGYLKQYRSAGGVDWPHADLKPATEEPSAAETVVIPGPLSGFKRMAAISQDVAPADLLTELARAVGMLGYQPGYFQEGLQSTEYLRLLTRYLSQARELQRLAGQDQWIRIETCESTQTADLLRVLGYRMRGGCGTEAVLETMNATRAFLTIDSGFPISELEQALRTSRPFNFDYSPSRVPVMWEASYWLNVRERPESGFIEAFIADPSLCRFYLAMSKPEPRTANELRKAIPAQRLKALAHVLDFYGSMLEIRDGRIAVPGGSASARMWEELVGVSPDKGAAFVERLISKDDGWLASYFDALSRISGPVRDYLTEPQRLKRFYTAIRGRVTSPGPARPVFRANTDMLLLTTRLRLEPDGSPHVPGGIAVWRTLFAKYPQGRYDAKLTRLAAEWKSPDDVLEAIFALCRRSTNNEPLHIFMALSDMNRARQAPLQTATVDRIIKDYRQISAQLPVLSEVPTLSDATILSYLDWIAAADGLTDELFADAVGIFQATTGLWQILCRQEAIPASAADSTLAGLIATQEKVRDRSGLVDSARKSVRLLLTASGRPTDSADDNTILELLTGGSQHPRSEYQTRAAAELMSYMEAQRLAPLSLLFQAAEHLDDLAQRGGKPDQQLLQGVSAGLHGLDASRSGMTLVERNVAAVGYRSRKHVADQIDMDFFAEAGKAGADSRKLRQLRSQLAPLIRDTLVGLNYAYYAPSGSQILRTNPLFVRSHDFIGTQKQPAAWLPARLHALGWPTSAGGRLVGSLAGLPYALAEAEQNFLIPAREQALIWSDLAPHLLLTSKVPRWWGVTPAQMHWLALHLRYGSALMAEAVLNEDLRNQVLEIFRDHDSPARVAQIDGWLSRGRAASAVENTPPSMLLVLARQMLARSPASGDVLAARIKKMAEEDPDGINYDAISRAFGTPKPSLTGSYRSGLLGLRTFPTLMRYSSRILAETWESNTVYFAALADELLLPPGQLNLLIPKWTSQTLEQIFASHLEDWPALLRSLHQVGARARAAASAGAYSQASTGGAQ